MEKAVDDSWQNFEMADFMSSQQRAAYCDRPARGGCVVNKISITL